MNTAPKLKTLLTTALLLASTGTLAQVAADPDYDSVASDKARVQKEATGLVSGFVLGAIVGGPPGAIITATAGALLGNTLHYEKDREQLLSSLSQTRKDYLALQEEKQALEQQYASAQQQGRSSGLLPVEFDTHAVLKQVCCTDAVLALHFRTNSSLVEKHYQMQLEEFARLVEQVPDASILITGYADKRGQSDTNLSLSQRRVEAVEQTLKSLGVRNTTIQTISYGETRPVSAGESPESYFYDRRVEVKLSSKDNDYLTSISE